MVTRRKSAKKVGLEELLADFQLHRPEETQLDLADTVAYGGMFFWPLVPPGLLISNSPQKRTCPRTQKMRWVDP